MATKAELEVELAELRRQLAERDQVRDEHAGSAASDDAPTSDPAIEDAGENWEELFNSITKEFEDLPQKRPLLVAAGIFAFGWLIGRSSR